MNDTEVDYKMLVQGRTGVEKTGPETKEFPASIIVKAIDQGKRQITALASAATLDRHDEVVLPEAFRELLPVYLKNPVVLTSHQHRLQTGHSSVIGTVVKAWIDSQGLWVVIEFAEGTELAEEYWQLYSQKIQRALSIGFIPIESQYEQRDGKNVLVHTKIELLELSCVPVGANREALTRSQQRKADFVAAKKEQTAEEKQYQHDLQELLEKEPNFDEKCQEFADLILNFKGSGEVPEDYDFSEADGNETELDFAEIVRGY